jgi:hypothetical protein
MWLLKNYNRRKKIKETIYIELEKALIEKDYVKSGILSKRFLKLNKYDYN